MPETKMDAFTTADLFDQETAKAQTGESAGLREVIASIVKQARAVAPDTWRDEVHAVQSQVRLRLEVAQMADPLDSEKLDDPTLPAKCRCYTQAIVLLEAAMTGDLAP